MCVFIVCMNFTKTSYISLQLFENERKIYMIFTTSDDIWKSNQRHVVTHCKNIHICFLQQLVTIEIFKLTMEKQHFSSRNICKTRPLVDTFKMYLCADTTTFCQMYLCTDTIQYQYISRVSDTDTFSIIFGPNFSFYCIFMWQFL